MKRRRDSWPRRMAAALAVLTVLAVGACEGDRAGDPLALTDGGMGPITKDTPFSLEAIADLFPDFVVEPAVATDGPEPYRVIRVVEGDQVLFTIVPDVAELTVYRVEVASPFVVLDNGAAVGDSFASLMDRDAPGDGDALPCARGIAELTPFVVCAAPGYRHIHYLFGGSWDGPSTDLPPRAVLAGWTLAELHFVP